MISIHRSCKKMNNKILIIEDAKFMRKMLKDIYEKNGYEIVGEANSCKEGIKYYKKFKPDLVTMDIIMPDMSGLEAVKKIIEFDPNANIIACSALSQKQLVKKVKDAGAKEFLEKPFDPSDLIEATEKILS